MSTERLTEALQMAQWLPQQKQFFEKWLTYVLPTTVVAGANVTVTADEDLGTLTVTTGGANSKAVAYTTVSADASKSIDHPASDPNPRTFTIAADASVPYPNGTELKFTNMAAFAVTIAINSDTMHWSPTGATGSRTLAQFGVATARKVNSSTWIISGFGLS